MMNFTWLQENALVIAFYLAVALIIYFNRKKFEFQGIAALFKTKFGIKQMKKFATPLSKKKDSFGGLLFKISLVVLVVSLVFFIFNSFVGVFNVGFNLLFLIIVMLSFLSLCVSIIFFRQIKLAGILGIYVGVLGMIFMLGLVGVGIYQLFFVPDADPLFAPVFPGISIPGVPFKLPLFEGLIALLVVVVIHEFSHGVVSKAYKISIKSSGFVMLGPLPGAFVEPDEKKLAKASAKKQLSIYAAGPFSNILLAGFVYILMFFLMIVSSAMYAPQGVLVEGFIPDSDLDERGLNQLQEGEVIKKVNNEDVLTTSDLINLTSNLGPGEDVLFTTNKGDRVISLGAHPDNESVPFIGIYLDNNVVGQNAVSQNQVFTTFYFWLVGNPFSIDLNKNLGLIALIFVLSFGIGIVNLLPAGPLDGGRMFFIYFKKRIGEKKTLRILSNISWALLFIILVLIFSPIIGAIF